MGDTLTRLGFLALKAHRYSQFPSIRKMSEDWKAIAQVAARGYNELADLQRLLREAQEERDKWRARVGALAGLLGDADHERDAAIKRAEAAEALAEGRRIALVLAYANIGQESWARMTNAAKNIIINAQGNEAPAEAQAQEDSDQPDQPDQPDQTDPKA